MTSSLSGGLKSDMIWCVGRQLSYCHFFFNQIDIKVLSSSAFQHFEYVVPFHSSFRND